MSHLEILKWPPTLTTPSNYVAEPTQFSDLVNDMCETTSEADGIGLAAPQVNHAIKMFVLGFHINAQKVLKMSGCSAFFNVNFTWQSSNKCPFLEGCLSCPGQGITVQRPCDFEITYANATGHINSFNSSDLTVTSMHHDVTNKLAHRFFNAAFQHEFEHLEGKSSVRGYVIPQNHDEL